MESNGFRMTYAAYLSYCLHYRYAKTWLFRLLTFGAPICMTAFGIYLGFTGDTTGSTGVFVLTGALIAWFLCLNFVFPVWGLWSAKRRGNYVQDCKIHIDSTHIWTNDPSCEIRKPWNSIESIFVTRHYGYIYFNGWNAFVVPKAAFNSVADADAFFARAKDCLAAAKAAA